MTYPRFFGSVLGACALSLSIAANAETYYGPLWNEDPSLTGYGMPGASLELSDDGTTVYGKYNKGMGQFVDAMVIYLDTRPGGFNNTANFYDNADTYRRAISLVSADGLNRGTAQFTAGFGADYAIAFGPEFNGGRLFELVGGSGSSFLPNPDGDPINIGLNPYNELSAKSYTFSFAWASVGLDVSPSKGFLFETLRSTKPGYVYLESMQNVTGAEGWGNTVTFSSVGSYGTVAVPEPGTGALLLAGLAGLVARRRMQR